MAYHLLVILELKFKAYFISLWKIQYQGLYYYITKKFFLKSHLKQSPELDPHHTLSFFSNVLEAWASKNHVAVGWAVKCHREGIQYG